MKKITALLFAGIIAMAFASVADAGTVLRTKSNVQTQVLAPKSETRYTYSTSTSSVNQSSGISYAGASDYYTWYYQMDAAMDGIVKTTMTNNGWTLVNSYYVNGDKHYRNDVYQKTEEIVTSQLVGVEKTKADVSSSVSYVMQDGELVAVKSSTIQETLTNVVNINTDTRTTTMTLSGYGEPITLDTTNTGKITTAKNEWLSHPAFYSEFASKFDFTGDGIADNCEWLSDNPDALLCMPVKGQINGVTELFGNLGGYANGYDKLSVLCDKDGNGIVEGSELEGLMLWVDSNRNGIADAGELKTLESYGITKFYTEHKDFVGKYETSDGQTHTMWAWFPSLQQ